MYFKCTYKERGGYLGTHVQFVVRIFVGMHACLRACTIIVYIILYTHVHGKQRTFLVQHKSQKKNERDVMTNDENT